MVHAAEIAEHIMASPSSVREFLSRFLGLENQEAAQHGVHGCEGRGPEGPGSLKSVSGVL